jgi:hypothetical protein
MTVRTPAPLAAAVGLAAATAEGLLRLPTRLPQLLDIARDKYDELALHGQDVLSGRHPEPETPVEVRVVTEPPAPAVPIGLTEPVTLPEDVLDEVAQLPSGADLDHAQLPLADFDHLTVPQLRGRLRSLALPELVQLRDYETAHANRLPVLTLLDNRMAKLADTP